MATKLACAHYNEGSSLELASKGVKEALLKLQGLKPSLCLLFGSIDLDWQDVLKEVRSKLGNDVQIMGSTAQWVFTNESFKKDSLGICLISSDEYQFLVKSATGLKDDVDTTFKNLKTAFGDFIEKEGKTSGIMLIDGLTGNGEESTLSAISAFETDIKIVGGAAADNLTFTGTKVIANDQILSNAVSFCMVKGPDHFFTGVEHGHIPLSEPLVATKAEANILYEIDGKPAWDVWKEKTKEAAQEVGINVDTISDAGEVGNLLLRFELGLESEDGYKIRIPLSKNDDGSLNFACTIPEDVTFKIMKSKIEDQIHSARETAKKAKAAANGKKVVGILVFDCVCRALILGEEKFDQAISAIKEEIGDDIPLIGFETFGEICMDPTQFSGFHNTTSVISLITE